MSNASEYFDKSSDEYVDKWRLLHDDPSNPTLYFRAQMTRRMLEMAAVRQGENLVELGCGTGLVLKESLEWTRPVFGTDISLEMLQRLQDAVLTERAVHVVSDFANISGDADVYLMVDDVRKVSLPKEYFDVILSMEVLRYVDDIERCFERVRAIAKPTSRFVFSITNLWSTSLFPTKFAIRKRLGRFNEEREVHQYFVTERSVREKLREAGFEIYELDRIRLLSAIPLLSRLLTRRRSFKGLQRIQAIDDALSKIPIIQKFCDTFLIAATPR